MIDRVHGSDHRQENLGGTYVRGRFLTSNMLLAGLQREAIGNSPATIDGNAHKAARKRALVRLPGCDIGRMRPAVAHRDAESLGRADRDVGAELARWSEQRERQWIGRHDRERAVCVESGYGMPKIPDLPGASGILKQRAEHCRRIEIRHRIGDDDLPAERLRARSHHGDRLRMAIAIDEERRRLRARDAFRHRHRFGRGRRLIEQRGIGDFQSREIGDHGLKVQQGLQSALADLGLVRRVGRIPSRVFQYVALDHRGQDRAVVTLADQRRHDLVA